MNSDKPFLRDKILKSRELLHWDDLNTQLMTFKCWGLRKFVALIWDHLVKTETFDSGMPAD